MMPVEIEGVSPRSELDATIINPTQWSRTGARSYYREGQGLFGGIVKQNFEPYDDNYSQIRYTITELFPDLERNITVTPWSFPDEPDHPPSRGAFLNYRSSSNSAVQVHFNEYDNQLVVEAGNHSNDRPIGHSAIGGRFSPIRLLYNPQGLEQVEIMGEFVPPVEVRRGPIRSRDWRESLRVLFQMAQTEDPVKLEVIKGYDQDQVDRAAQDVLENGEVMQAARAFTDEAIKIAVNAVFEIFPREELPKIADLLGRLPLREKLMELALRSGKISLDKGDEQIVASFRSAEDEIGSVADGLASSLSSFARTTNQRFLTLKGFTDTGFSYQEIEREARYEVEDNPYDDKEKHKKALVWKETETVKAEGMKPYDSTLAAQEFRFTVMGGNARLGIVCMSGKDLKWIASDIKQYIPVNAIASLIDNTQVDVRPAPEIIGVKVAF